jgi:hypothetical protein
MIFFGCLSPSALYNSEPESHFLGKFLAKIPLKMPVFYVKHINLSISNTVFIFKLKHPNTTPKF